MAETMVGQFVPDIRLPASNGEEVALTDFKGQFVVLYFYPKDMTPGCTTEACDFRDHHQRLKELGVKVIGVSPDDVKSHQKFIEKHHLPFLLLADTEQRLARHFQVWTLKKMFGKEYMGIERSTFVIDPEGKIVKEWRKVKVKGHVQEVIRNIEQLTG
ncbi:alkyl hydroperoxide reductase/ Thiol specific antioxidant/ Mal allergen [Caldalkalibacillus thermarum TA2.A1]|uniref:thioredoxin-dependent peroxiredoxin n=2 Tax=Caldalkalibacillus thermarum (strain TA2.A1) TaxID=986075 RepID=F5L3Q8_CALTT|nr:thioredoxin-dependent thiol peroxidase [Caldalkalibacillus thermarum]EGL84029.1 alkyl hydroperoxide reductase/ Thiol specific antioxidant/ Mal allergen [Caldalkalibacillus thermarum TA2.A1]